MKAKIIILALCAVQIATGFSVNDILEKAQQLFNNVLNEAETTLGSFENQSNEIFSNLLDDAKSKLNDLVPTIENEITKEFSDVANAAPKIQACLEAEKQNLSAIVDDAYKQVQTLTIKESLVTVPFVGKVNSTINDTKTYLKEVTSALEACTKLSLLKSVSCATKAISNSEDKAKSLLTNVQSEIEQGKQVLNKVLPDVSATITKIVQSTEEKAEAIGTEIVQCVQTSLKA